MYIAGESKDTKSKRRIELCPEEWDDSFGEGFYEHTLENGFYYIAPNSEWNPQAGCVLAPGINQSTPESPAQLQLKINELRREKIPTMDNYQLEHYFSDSTNIDTSQDVPEVLVNLAGYQVTKAELFAHHQT